MKRKVMGPRGDHNAPGRAWGSWRARVGCAHLVHLPLVLFAPKVHKHLEKIMFNFQVILRTFFGVIFLLHGKNQKTDKTWHFILFN